MMLLLVIAAAILLLWVAVGSVVAVAVGRALTRTPAAPEESHPRVPMPRAS